MTINPETFSPNKQALLKIRELKRQLAAAQVSTGEPVAIVSMACRFPRTSRTPEEFWQCLMNQTDEVSDIPADRWDLEAFHDDDPEVPGKMYARRGVFLDNLDQMDPEFFGISPREATWVDPQQRLLMEVGWEALERAGWPAEKIGEHTGIFVGWMHNDYQNEASDSFLNLNPYIATGAAGSFLCGRLAYYLGLEGPSVAVDTACSSSLVALHLAVQSLQQRDCDRALVGGVNAICSPTTNILTCKLKALSPHGHSRAFDAAADGYLRGEGCGVVTLRRLSDAQTAGDPILGIIRGSAVGHNGFSSGLTAPNPKAQTKVIRQALRRAKLDPHEVAYLEAHGTGTELGDPIEMQAAAAALADDRSNDHPLLVGSVKTNIGHLEAAAGMAGLIKVLLAMQNNKIPGQLNFETPNPHIPWNQIAVNVLTEATDWPKNQPRIAGVSAFGMSGTNAHVIIESPPTNGKSATLRGHQPNIKSPQPTHDSQSKTAPQLVVFSARNETALVALGESFARRLATKPDLNLLDVAYSASVCRGHFEHRAALIAHDCVEATEKLQQLVRTGGSDSVFVGDRRRAPKVAWQFTGQGSQYGAMTRGLYDSQAVFRDAVDQCDQLLQPLRGESLIDVLFHDDGRIHDTFWTQPAIFAVQMGLAQLLQSWGMQPDCVLGHSVGQYAAACVAGIMSWETGLHLISERGRLIGELPAGGRMLAVFAPVNVVQSEIKTVDDVSLAALNGTHIVVSGSTPAVDSLEAKLTDRGIRTKPLTTSHAFHSSLMDPALESFQQAADQFQFDRARLPLICNVSGTVLAADAKLDGEYWARHIREAVRYAEGIESVADSGCELILELGPQSVLTRMAASVWQRPAGSLISCLSKGEDDSTSILNAVGQLYVQGVTPDFDAMYTESQPQRVLLPTYPFQRRRFWGPDKPRAFHAEYHTAHPLLGSRVSLAGVSTETRFENFIDIDSPAWLSDHEVMGHVVLPGAAYVEMAIAAAGSDAIEEVVFETPLRPAGRTALQTVVRSNDTDSKSIETFSAPAGSSQWTRNFSAKIAGTKTARPDPVDRSGLQAGCSETATPDSFYQKMLELGLHYGPDFQTIKSLQYSSTEVLTQLKTNGDMRGFTIPPTLLDGALHSLAVGLLREDDGHLFLPVGIGRVSCFQAIENEVWCHATWTQNEGKLRTADLVLFTETGQVVAEISQLKVQQVSLAALRQMSGDGTEQLTYELNWERFRLPASDDQNRKWLIVSGSKNEQIVDRLTNELEQRGHSTVQLKLQPGDGLERVGDTQFRLSGQSEKDWESLWETLSTGEASIVPDGIAWLFDPLEDSRVTDRAEIDPSTKTNCQGLLNLIEVLSRKGQRRIACGLQLISTDAICIDQEVHVDPKQTQYWGLGRVIGAEQPELRCRLIDLDSTETEHPETVAAVLDILLTETHDNQLAIREGQFFVPRMKRASVAKKGLQEFAANPNGSYLITGGLGRLGRQAAKWLAQHGATQIVLVSRRSPDESLVQWLDSIRSEGCQITIHPADLSSRKDVEQLFARFGDDLNPLSGLIHAAGILDDGLLGEQSWERFEKVLAPKVIGASLLDDFTRSLELDFFLLYSSAASVLGSPGQSNYATANAFLDGLAWQRHSLGLPATSINWGPWTEGMADDQRIVKRLALQGIAPLTIDDAHATMETILAADLVQATVIDVDWRKMRIGLGGESPAMLERLTPTRQKSQMGDSELVSQLKRLTGETQKDLLVKTIQQSLQGILATPGAPEIDRPLIEMGLDSLMAVEFGTELQQMLGDQFAVGPTMLFDHPTIDAISEHVLELVAGTGEEATPAISVDPGNDTHAARQVRDDIAIIGMSCRFPGANNIEEFWQNLLDGVDSVQQIPADRWDIDRFYSAEREPGKMYTREGGFLDDIADFDADFFGISQQEACWIDPQHRMLLENSFHAMEDAGIATSPLQDSNVGVFIGIMGQDYAFLPSLDDIEVIKAFQGAGLSHSAGVGRISYVFGFEGPSVAVDTASSSSLVAVLQAVRALQDGNCNLALAGGVNAILAPVNSLLMSKAGLLSPDGRCKSFSADANGFGRGEGCGVIVLKRLGDAQRDGDRIMAVIRGGAVVHNGFSGGITSPSGKAQSRVINDALKDAGIAPSQVQYLEAHGTGTEFGDPMELGAAAAVYGKGRQPEQKLLVGSVKANISHLEAAGGISGLIKTVLAIDRGLIPPQAHFEQPSPHIPWQRLPVQMVTETTQWPAGDQRLAGVTALGLVGTNAHVVLSSAPAATEKNETKDSVEAHEPVNDRSYELLVLSARSQPALKELAENHCRYLETHPGVSLADICYTATSGRRHFEHRIALTVESANAAVDQLDTWTGNQGSVSQDNPSTNGHLGAATGNESQPIGIVAGCANKAPKLGWIFSDRETFDPRAAHELFSCEPTFRTCLQEFAQHLREHSTDSAPIPEHLLSWLEGPSPQSFVASDVQQFAIQSGLAKVWREWGIEPDVALGLGVGQYTAACVAGGLCDNDALILVLQREHLLATLQSGSPTSNGRSESESLLNEEFKKALDDFEALADTFNFYPPNLPLICSLDAALVPVHRSLGGSYWRRHCLAETQTVESVFQLAEMQCNVIQEIGPPQDSDEQANPIIKGFDGVYLPSPRVDQDTSQSMLNTLGQLYVAGVNPNFRAFNAQRNRNRISLPPYPFQKKRYWITEIADYMDEKETIKN